MYRAIASAGCGYGIFSCNRSIAAADKYIIGVPNINLYIVIWELGITQAHPATDVGLAASIQPAAFEVE
jgi:hypothetical protein